MKKLVVFSLMAACCLAGFAKEAKLTNECISCREGCMTDWTPFALTLCGPVGLPWGDWNVKGLQIGVFNSVNELSGLQIGVVNIADRAYGMQIGVVNVITTDDVSFLPIVNWSF